MRRLRNTLIALGAVAFALVLADFAARFYVQWRIEQAVQDALPAGVSGEARAEVHGFSVLWQILTRDFEHLVLDTQELRVGELALSARLDAYGVALLDGGGIQQLRGSVTLPAESINVIAQLSGAASGVTLGDGTISYGTQINLFGMGMQLLVDASVAAQGDRLILEASRVQVQGSGVNIDAAEWFGGSAAFTVPICSAEYMPAGVHITDVSVRPEGVTVSLSAQGVTIDRATIESRGSCRGG